MLGAAVGLAAVELQAINSTATIPRITVRASPNASLVLVIALTSLPHKAAAVQVVLAVAGGVLRNRRINSFRSYSYAGIRASFFMKGAAAAGCSQ